MKILKLSNTHKNFGNTQVIKGVDLEIAPGEFCVFVGPSGCGKSTLLRMIAGLEDTTSGSIHIGDKDVTKLDPAMRGVAMVFQTYALYPHMTVEQNMGFGLKMNRLDKATIAKKVNAATEILKLENFRTKYPKELSGGQRQRVAIGRAIVRSPDVFLFDEPLSNLDAELRVDMRVEIARLHRTLKTTMVYVTHDQVEAMTLADRIVVLKAGKIEQVGNPIELYENPDNKFVAGFIGSPAMNFLAAEVKDHKAELAEIDLTVEVPKSISGKVIVGIRPEHLQIDLQKDTSKIEFIERLGGSNYVYSNSRKGNLIISQENEIKDLKNGTKMGLRLKGKSYFFDPETEKRLR